VETGVNIYFYTMHKAASDYVAFQIMRPIAAARNMQHVDLGAITFQSGKDFREVVSENADLFAAEGKYFGALRHGDLPGINYRANDKVIVHIRDPRDCLTSLYFSVIHSHPVPQGPAKDRFLQRREQISQMSVDEFCLREAKGKKPIIDSYINLISGHCNVILSKYEDMVSGFDQWLARLFDFLEIPTSHPLFGQLVQAADFTVQREDVTKHKRRVKPGDFYNKLQPETINTLNEIYADTLEAFRYPLVPPDYTLWSHASRQKTG